jgi:hypothetical protein
MLVNVGAVLHLETGDLTILVVFAASREECLTTGTGSSWSVRLTSLSTGTGSSWSVRLTSLSTGLVIYMAYREIQEPCIARTMLDGWAN